MTTTPDRAAIVAHLRAQLAREGVGVAEAVLPFDIEALDRRLAAGGLAGSALHEVAAARPQLPEDAAASLFLAGLAARFAGQARSVIWAVLHFDLYSPGLEQVGLDASRTLFVEARDDARVLAAMEDAARHGGVAAVIGEVRRADLTATRRLQLAAADGRTPVLLYRRWRKTQTCPLVEPSAAATRWRIGCAPSARPAVGIGRARWLVELVRQRGGDPFSFVLESCDATGRLALPAAAADRATVAGGTTARAA